MGIGSTWSPAARAALSLGGIELTNDACEALRLFDEGVRGRS
jgi:hypothetical protein